MKYAHLLDPKSCLLTLTVSAFLVLGTALVAWLWPWPDTPTRPTAVLTVVPLPTTTPTLPSTPTMPIRATPTPLAPPPPNAGEIGVGLFVQIRGTGGDGLRLRSAPSLQAPVRFLGREDEVFLVTDGPRQADGYTWWHLEAPYDTTRSGWAVANYLSPLPTTPSP